VNGIKSVLAAFLEAASWCVTGSGGGRVLGVVGMFGICFVVGSSPRNVFKGRMCSKMGVASLRTSGLKTIEVGRDAAY
jgi:hypothetical protein